jgi:DNA-binding winged helix-turn-helix (wHTH) protein
VVHLFGPYRLDTAERRLLRDGREIPLTPKAFDLLRLLIDHRPRALSKDEILGTVWSGVFVTENNLATVVRDLRAALHDDAAAPRFIRTAFGFGYAFVAEVTGIPPVDVQVATAWRLIVEAREFALAPGEYIVGRSAPATIVVEGSTISRRHARLVVTSGGVRCEDLGSKNGTLVGDVRVGAPTEVHDGDWLRFGSVRAVLRRRDAVTTQTAELA